MQCLHAINADRKGPKVQLLCYSFVCCLCRARTVQFESHHREDSLSRRPNKIENYLPKSSESQVSDVSVPVTFVANVDADSVDVLIVVSAVDADDAPITITFTGRKFNYNIFRFFSFTRPK